MSNRLSDENYKKAKELLCGTCTARRASGSFLILGCKDTKPDCQRLRDCATGLDAQLEAQLAACLLVQDKKRAELAKEIFDELEERFPFRYAQVIAEPTWKSIKAKYLQEKGQTK